MRKPLPSLGEFEVEVLRHVWENEPCTERRIWDLIEHRVGRTTVLKTVQRLEGKGLLVRVRNSSPVQFKAVVDESRMLPELVGRFVDSILGGSAEPLVAYLADSKRLSANDLQTLRTIAARIRKGETS